MPLNYLYQVKILVRRLALVYLLYFLCRVLFYVFNRDFFSSVGFTELMKNSFYGLRFDTFSIFATNSFFILLSIIPISLFYENWYQQILKWLFIPVNTAALLTNSIDFAYFPFIKKRSGADLFNQVGGQTDMGKLLPQYIRDFWWVLVIIVVMTVILTFLYKKIKIQPRVNEQNSTRKTIATILIFLLSTGIAVLGLRGGTQRYPIGIINAGEYASAEQVPIILNTPFTLIKSAGQEELKEFDFYSEKELISKYNTVHHFDSMLFTKKNVVIIILESFAKEYTRLGKTGTSYTPFLDSLCNHSLVFSNGVANGSKSIEGIPAILSGLPHLMENPFINSSYSNNYQTTFATLLGKEGYTTAFFHGGINGTMNFDTYSKLAGYTHYFGKNEYNNDEDFDGFWGIWDEPFFHYTIKKMNDFREPFHSSIFTLSSHHPYNVPSKYKGKFPKGHLENTASVGYTDFALRQFFYEAKKTKWYNNTLFVLCADHTSLSDHPFYKNIVGQQCIPVIFYCPGDSLKGEDDRSFSQIDILPSVMNYLGYNKPFFAFGQSYLKKKNNNCYYYINGNHLMIADSLMLSFNNSLLQTVYNFKRDSSLHKNIIGIYPDTEKKLTEDFRAFIQIHNSSVRNNTMRLK